MVPRTGYPGDDDFSPVPVGTDGSSHRPPHGEQTPSRPCGDGWFYIDDAPRIVNDCPVHTWTDGSEDLSNIVDVGTVPSLWGRMVLQNVLTLTRLHGPVPVGTDGSLVTATAWAQKSSRPCGDGWF